MKAMKKSLVTVLTALFLLLLLSCAASAATPVAAHGRLSVSGTKIVDKNGKAFQIKGVSTHGLAWFPQYVSKAAFQDLRDNWGANTVRLAMYTAEYNGYCVGGKENQKNLKKKIDEGVKVATDLGMYVIIDWHVLNDRNPNTYKNQAVSFFKEMARKYKDHNNVIYEICNEPNGGVTWPQIKTYAQTVIKAIRAIDKNAIIVVGTPTWSQDVDIVAKSPIKGYKNLVYTLHFYAGTHKDSYRAKAQAAINAGLPLLVSEFGISDASGNGGINESEGNKWITFLNKNKIGYAAWSLCNKAESSALIKSSCSKTSGWKYTDLTQSGRWLVKTYGGKLAKTAGVTSGTAQTSLGTASKPTTTAKPGAATKPAGTVSRATSQYCRAKLEKVGSWDDGSRYYTQYKLTVTNKSKKTIAYWKVRLKFKYAVQQSSGWNANYRVLGKYIGITPTANNKKITPLGSVTEIGFIVSSAKKDNPVVATMFR